MKKFFCAFICASLLIGSAVSVSAEEADPTGILENVDHRDKIIGSLIREEDMWLNNSKGIEMTLQFADLDFDGDPEFIVNSRSMNNFLSSDIYNLRTGDYDGFVKSEGESESAVDASGLAGYYDSVQKEYKVIGTKTIRDEKGTIGDVREITYEVKPETAEYNRRFETAGIASISENTGTSAKTYYDSEGNTIDEARYNELIADSTKGLIDINMKFDSYKLTDSTAKFDDYRNKTEQEKRDILGALYDSFTYDGVAISESEPTSSTTATSSTTSTKTAATTTATQPDYEKYVLQQGYSKYGSADVSDMTRGISAKNSYNYETIRGWAKRDGVLGYDIIDMNNDGIDDMLLYWFDGSEDSSTLKVDYYTGDSKGNIVYKNTQEIYKDAVGTDNYCVGEIVEIDGKKYLCVEAFQMGRRFSDGRFASYRLFGSDNNNDLNIIYNVTQSGVGSWGYEYWKLTLNDNGDYDKEVIWTFDDYNTKSMEASIESALISIGFPKADEKTGDVLESLGYKNYKKPSSEKNAIENYPSYFDSQFSKKSFHMINTAVDGTVYGDMEHEYEFISTVKFYGEYNSSASAEQGNTANTAGDTNNNSGTVKSPNTGTPVGMALIVVGILIICSAMAVSAKRKIEE